MLQKNDPLVDNAYVYEAFICGLFWNNPELYKVYSHEKLSEKYHFGNPIWGFYFGLGRYLAEKNLEKLDDISSAQAVEELGFQQYYDKYGRYTTISELMEETKDKEENLEAYYNEVKKYSLLRDLRELFGNKVAEKTGKYDYTNMTAEQVHKYWSDKVNKLGVDNVGGVEHCYLLEGLRDDIKEWDKNPDVGLPFYKSSMMTKMTNGFAHGHVYMFGGFGGKGKTSFCFNKVIMSCLEQQEKLLVIANEQGINEFKQLLLISVIGSITKKPFNRRRLIEGSFTDEEKEILEEAVQKVEEISGGNNKLISFVFLEKYTIDNVKRIIRHYAHRGYSRVIIDTGKPSEDRGNTDSRWERFVEDCKEIYKLARPNGGGLNLAVWINVQLADNALKYRFLDEHALGEGKKAKNEASCLFMMRTVWDDELSGGQNELDVFRWEFNEFSGKYDAKKKIVLEPNKQYYLLFLPKNRRGLSNDTGQYVLVLEPNFNFNTWKEVGWTRVFNDRNY